jgi:hypothetical protein
VEAFCISSTILGSEKHMVVSQDGFTTLSKAPTDLWFLNGVLDPLKPLCLDTLLKLKNVEVPTKPAEKWTKSMSLLTSGSAAIPWSQTMPSVAYKSFVKSLVKFVAETIDELPKDYYKSTWCPGGQLLCSLRAAKVDPKLYREISAEIERDSGAFETFKPGPGGFLPPVVYDRFATRTGRLTVESGPNILTLKKKYRQILKSTFAEGAICSLDFGALEARIILAENGKVATAPDLYSSLATELFGGTIDREAVKIAVISELYGASKSALGARLGIGSHKLEEFVTKVRSYFGTAELRKRLKEEFIKTGKIRNKHGRFLDLDDPQDHLFVNTYAQSTGVDVSLLGFKAVLEKLGTDGVRPLFVLHDALILDVREDRLSDVEAIRSTSVPGYASEFPLKFERL